MPEKCQRCGEVGEDRRTLQMACFYDMSELSLPFKKQTLFHADVDECEPVKGPTTVDLAGERIVLKAGTVRCNGGLTPQSLYTLRVCKDCRAAWMMAIRQWFNVPVNRSATGTGVYIRRAGATVEATEEEVESLRRRAERER